MTIKYPNGQTVEATILSRSDDRMRVITRDGEDVIEFAKVAGAWISEELEPVKIIFEWQRHDKKPPVTEADCICSKELAERLIQVLLYGCDEDQMEIDRPDRIEPASAPRGSSEVP